MSARPPRWRRRAYSINALRLLARAALPRPIFDFADGGAEDEHTLQRNESASDKFELLPHPLNGAAERGHHLPLRPGGQPRAVDNVIKELPNVRAAKADLEAKVKEGLKLPDFISAVLTSGRVVEI
jgi:hypothetical protein